MADVIFAFLVVVTAVVGFVLWSLVAEELSK